MVTNTVEMVMGDEYSYAIITKERDYKVLVIFYDMILIVYGGRNLDIPKLYKPLVSSSDAYKKFMYVIGKMCKKSNDLEGHYFSDRVSDLDGNLWVSEKISDNIKNIRGEILKEVCLCE